MLPFSTVILRDYYRAIGWNEDNSYSQLSRSSSSLLDFQLPQSLILQLANAPTSVFFTSYALDALPQLNGSLTYITTSEALSEIDPSRNVPFQSVVDRFRIFPLPHRPRPKDEVWLGGRRVEGRDYLLYSRLHFPSLHLSGLATTRLTSTLQFQLAFLSYPSPPSTLSRSNPNGPSHNRQPSETSTPNPSNPPGNVLLSLQHDTGRYASEYTYSVQDGMFGFRGLWNFGWVGLNDREKRRIERMEGGDIGDDLEEGEGGREGRRSKAVDEEEMMEGGLKGRFSAGGEVYLSAKQRSFGVSTGIRFTTLPTSASSTTSPTAASSSSQSSLLPYNQPPTTVTLVYNPLIGFLSTAYAAQVSPTVALSSRFGVNVYSYESDLAIGGEWWIGRRRGKRESSGSTSTAPPSSSSTLSVSEESVDRHGRQGAREAILEEGDLRSSYDLEKGHVPGPFEKDRVSSSRAEVVKKDQNSSARDGVLKAKITGDWSVALLYEARIRNCLVSLGLSSDLLSRQKPIKSIGVEVQYFS